MYTGIVKVRLYPGKGWIATVTISSIKTIFHARIDRWKLSHMKESCHICIWMSHVTYLVWVMSQYEWVMSHLNESCHIWTSHVTYGWVMSHMDESCYIPCLSHVTYGWVMSHLNASCHIWMSHVTHWWVMSHMNESSHIPCLSHVTIWIIVRAVWHPQFSTLSFFSPLRPSFLLFPLKFLISISNVQ